MTDKPTTAQELEELFGTVDLEQVIWDSIVEEMKEAHNKQLFDDINPDIILHMKINRPMNAFEKLQEGWWWISQIFDEWCWQMTHDNGWEFFEFLHHDHIGYVEDCYYE